MPTVLDLHDPEPGSAPRLRGVGPLRRGAARLVDLAVLAAVWHFAAPVAVLLAFTWASYFGPPGYAAIERVMRVGLSESVSTAVTALVGLLAVVCMHSFWEGVHGSTLGKRLFGLTVVSEDGAPASFGAGVKRSLGFLIDQVPLGLLGAWRINESPRGQRIGDEWADTLVVRVKDVPPGSRRSIVRFVVALVAGLLAGAVAVMLGVSAWIGYYIHRGEKDRIEIVAARQTPPGPFRAGDTVSFVVAMTFELDSAPVGRLRLAAFDGDTPTPAGERSLVGGRGLASLEARVQIPEHRPGYAQPGVVRFGVALFPALNVEAPSAQHTFEIAIVPCDPLATGDLEGQLCTG